MKRLAAFLLPLFALLLFFVPAHASPPQIAYIHFDGEVNAESAKTVVKAFDTANEHHARVIVFDFTTPGGTIPDGYKIAKSIEMTPAMVLCVVDGRAESMGFAILQSCDVRIMTRRSFLMAHQPYIAGTFVMRETEAKNVSDEFQAVAAGFAFQCSHRLHMTLDQYKAKVANGRDWYLQPDDALKVGAVDDVTNSVKDVAATAQKIEAQMKKARPSQSL